MRFLDLFSGVGGFRLGLEMEGHECVGHCEIDKFANKSYIAMHNPKESEWFGEDITKVRADELPRADIWCFGFPCQDISIAGKQSGFGGHRSSLFFTVTRLIRDLEEENRPSILFIENVKNLLSINRGGDFLKLLIELDEIGYDAEWQVLNSKDFGVPQNRERVFIVGHLRGRSRRKIFPIGQSGKVHNGPDQAEKEVYETALCLTAKGQSNWTRSFINVVGNLDRPQYHESSNRVYDIDGIAPAQNTQQGGGHETKIAIPVLTPDRINKRQNGRRFKEDGEPMFTLTAQDRHGVAVLRPVRTEYGKAIRRQYEAGEIEESRHNMTQLEPRTDGISNTITTVQKDNMLIDNFRIRKLTPRECFRLQGFPDEYFERARAVNSDSQLYKQAGNSVTVNVIYEIARRF